MAVPEATLLTTRTYRSSSEMRRLDEVLCSLLAELPLAIRLGFALALRQYQLRYRTSRLRYFWVFASPFLYAVIFVVVREGMTRHGLSIDTGGLPPGVFAFAGVVMYQVWIQGLLGQADSLRDHRRLVAESRLPPEAFFFAAIFGSVTDLALRLMLIGAAAMVFGVGTVATAWAAPLIGLSVVLTGNALGYLLLPVATVYRDLQTGIRSVALGILLLSPVFYPATQDAGSLLFFINRINPLAAGVTTLRDALFGGDFVLLSAAVAWTVVLAVAACFWMVAMRVMFPILAERLG